MATPCAQIWLALEPLWFNGSGLATSATLVTHRNFICLQPQITRRSACHVYRMELETNRGGQRKQEEEGGRGGALVGCDDNQSKFLVSTVMCGAKLFLGRILTDSDLVSPVISCSHSAIQGRP